MKRYKKRKLNANTYFDFNAWNTRYNSDREGEETWKQEKILERKHGNTLRKEFKNTFKRLQVLDPKNAHIYQEEIENLKSLKFTKENKYNIAAEISEFYEKEFSKFASYGRTSLAKVSKETNMLTKAGKIRKRKVRPDTKKSKRSSLYNADLNFNVKKAIYNAITTASVFPYIDSNGNFNGDDYIFIVLSKADLWTQGRNMTEEFFEHYTYNPVTGSVKGKLSKKALRIFKDIIYREDLSEKNRANRINANVRLRQLYKPFKDLNKRRAKKY